MYLQREKIFLFFSDVITNTIIVYCSAEKKLFQKETQPDGLRFFV